MLRKHGPEVWMCKLAGTSGRTFAATRAHVPTPNTMTSYLHVGNRRIPSGFSIAPLPFSILRAHTNKTLILEKAAQCLNSLTKKPSVHITCDTMTSLRSALSQTVTHFMGLSATGGREETDVSVSVRSGGKITDLPDSLLPLPRPPLLLTVCFV